MKHRTEAGTRGITIDDKRLGELGQLQHRGGRQRPFQCVERCRSLRRPSEAIFLEQLGQWSCDRAVILDEPAVVAGQSLEPAEAAHGTRLWPFDDRCDFVLVHSNAVGRDDMAKIRNRRLRKRTFGAFEAKLMISERRQDCIDML